MDESDLCLMRQRVIVFHQLQTNFVLLLYVALPFSLGSMTVTGGLIYSGKERTLKHSYSIVS